MYGLETMERLLGDPTRCEKAAQIRKIMGGKGSAAGENGDDSDSQASKKQGYGSSRVS
jgi:hypothetical protein